MSHRLPAFLPDGNRFLFLVWSSTPGKDGVYLGSLNAASTPRRLFGADSAAEYAAPGYVLTARNGMLVAVPFDGSSEKLSAEQVVLAPQVAINLEGGVAFSVSASGLVAYRAGIAMRAAGQNVWVDRKGNVTSTLPVQGFPNLTADGRYIAVNQRIPREVNSDIWLLDTAGGVPRQFTFDPAFEVNSIWSPDGNRVVFASNRNGVFDLFEKPVSFARDERTLLATPNNKFPADWSPDGRLLLFVNEDEVTGDDLWAMSYDEPQKPVLVLGGQYAESQGQFSPDGRWLAYRSNESGRWEIYLRPYPGPGSQQQVSRGGGMQPRWRRDGKELFYMGAGGGMMAVPIHLPVEGGGVLEVGAPAPLFVVRLEFPSNQQFGYAVDPSGQRFLINVATNQTVTAPITILYNWTSVLSK